jgi:hypothetical protein
VDFAWINGEIDPFEDLFFFDAGLKVFDLEHGAGSWFRKGMILS